MTAARCYGAPKPAKTALHKLVHATGQFCSEVVVHMTQAYGEQSTDRIAA
jgi:HD-GYP domain-containing protein (c-di-GMP phosphodiesterase class II)